MINMSTKRKINKALGITKAKRKIASTTGIPTTKNGRKQKIKKHLNFYK